MEISRWWALSRTLSRQSSPLAVLPGMAFYQIPIFEEIKAL